MHLDGRKSRIVLVLAAAALFLVACRPTAQDLASTLPSEIDGHKTLVTAVGSELSGLVTDDAITSLGKSRQDAAQATAFADPDVAIIAVAVNGISGADLRTALVGHWSYSGSVTTATVGSKPVLVLSGPDGATTYFYVRETVVYVIQTKERPSAEGALAGLK